eukprot:481524_1
MSDKLLVLIDNLIDFVTDEIDSIDKTGRLFETTKIKIHHQKKTEISVIATTQRLIIRPVQHDDIDFYQNKLWGSEVVMKKFGSGNVRLFWPNTTTKEINYAKNRIEIWIKRWKQNNPFSGYTVVETQTNNKIGHVIVGEGELAFLFEQNSWCKGYGTEAVTTLINIIIPYLYKHSYSMNIDNICATVRADNIASQRVMEKSGLKTDRKVHFKRFEDSLYERLTYEISIASLVENLKYFKNVV